MNVNLVVFGPEPDDLADPDGPYSHCVVLWDGNGARADLTYYQDGRSDMVVYAANGSSAVYQNPTVLNIINAILTMAGSKVVPIVEPAR